MRVKNNILVIDTETVGDFACPLVHDIGYVIIDKNFKVLQERRFLVSQPRFAGWVMNSEFYNGHKQLYEEAIKENGKLLISWQEITATMLADIKKYKVKTLAAYNLAFDYRAISFTHNFLSYIDKTFMAKIDKLNKLCIWNMACDSFMQTETYRTWCVDKEKKSDKGNYKTDAETAYQFITDTETIEEHTALEDVKLETDILKYIVTKCQGIAQYGLYYSVWRKVQK